MKQAEGGGEERKKKPFASQMLSTSGLSPKPNLKDGKLRWKPPLVSGNLTPSPNATMRGKERSGRETDREAEEGSH